jgi:hypothetical protein
MDIPQTRRACAVAGLCTLAGALALGAERCAALAQCLATPSRSPSDSPPGRGP